MPFSLGLIFTIDIDGKPIVVFEAKQLREAAQLCTEEWLRADLNELTSNGVPLCGIGSKISARMASESERATYQEAAVEATASDDIVFAYLLEIDGIRPGAEGTINGGSIVR
jgi:hypothetical protein